MEFKEQNQLEDNGIDSLMQWSQFLKYKKITVDHDIYIKVFTDVTMYYSTFYTDDVINNTNNETAFTEIKFLKTI